MSEPGVGQGVGQAVGQGPSGTPYHQLLTRGRPGWAWPLLGVVGLAAAALLAQVVLVVVFTVGLALGGTSMSEAGDILAGTGEVTPTYLALLNLSLAVLVPLVMFVVLAVHRLGPGWVASVAGRMRWRWLLTCLGLSVIALVATVAVSAVLPQQGDGTEMSGGLNDFTRTTRDFLLVVVLLTPLQAAGEEYAFRGYLTQGFGSAFARWPRVSVVVSVLVPAVLFALAHGAQDLPVFVDRLAFGLVAGVLVIATGGLEAGIAMHVLNNFLAFGLALAYGDMTSALNPTGGSWWSLPVTLTQSLVYLALAIGVARRRGIATRSDPVAEAPPGGHVLAGSDPRV